MELTKLVDILNRVADYALDLGDDRADKDARVIKALANALTMIEEADK